MRRPRRRLPAKAAQPPAVLSDVRKRVESMVPTSTPQCSLVDGLIVSIKQYTGGVCICSWGVLLPRSSNYPQLELQRESYGPNSVVLCNPTEGSWKLLVRSKFGGT